MAVGVAAVLASACGGPKLPPSLPSTGVLDRAASRVELVSLVISDPARAARVRALYIEIERLMLATKRVEAAEFLRLGSGPPPSEPETHAAMQRFAEAELAALRRYITLQMQLRRELTPEEFVRLDAVK